MRLEAGGLSVEVPDRTLFTGVDLSVPAGASVAIVGPSGSGKTSLLNALVGIIPAAASRLTVNGTDLLGLTGRDRASFRLHHIGLVFQFAELLPEFNVVENVALPLRFAGFGRDAAHKRACAWLDRVGLDDRLRSSVDVLSGGERQRVAVARSLCSEPVLVVADEPTGSLDRTNADAVAGLLVDCASAASAGLVIATHDERVAGRCDRIFALGPCGLDPLPAATS